MSSSSATGPAESLPAPVAPTPRPWGACLIGLRTRFARAAGARDLATFGLVGGSTRGLRFLSADPTRRGIIAALAVSVLFMVATGARLASEQVRGLAGHLRWRVPDQSMVAHREPVRAASESSPPGVRPTLAFVRSHRPGVEGSKSGRPG